MGLQEYRKKRNFKKTTEPQGGKSSKKNPLFVVQEHWASHLHYDFRLEAFGTLKSWAVPKGPSTKVGDRRLAVEVEDHPIAYATFKGKIPEGEYGAGTVKIWDHGTWLPPDHLRESLEKGHLEFELKGKKLKGKWLLQRTGKSGGRKSQWLLIKRHDVAEIKKPIKTNFRDPWPEKLSPQLAKLTDQVPQGANWIHELKLDGYRTMTYVKKSSVKLLTRNGLDWTEKYSPLDDEFKKLKVGSAIFDGEIVALDEKGRSNFSLLQKALKADDLSGVVYYLFDLLYLDGQDLREEPLETRKLMLKKILQKSKSKKLLYSDHVRALGDELFKKACREGLEGIVSKERTRPFFEGRGDDWRKIKCSLRQEFVIAGYTDPEGHREGFGALLMGAYEGGKLRSVGRVGTGFDSSVLKDLRQKFKKLEISKSPFEIAPPPKSGKVHWLKPTLVAEIEFKTWTEDQNLRHASYQGLREDKKAKDVQIEKVKTSKAPKNKIVKAPTSKFKVTHPERLIYAKQKISKMDVARYYKSVAPWLLKHLADRPLSLLRCPEGAGEHCFFQKHIATEHLPAVKEVLIKDQKAVYVDSEDGLLQLIQWGVLELHVWQSHQAKALFADQLIFDLDPDEAVPWKNVVRASFSLKELLEKLNLKSFVKTTGGKGVHLHVPIAPIYSWDQIKAFAKTVSQQLESEHPDLYTTNISKKVRTKKIFLDYLRNGFGATAVAPYSLRSKEKAFVAVPITWEELKTLKGPQTFDLQATLERLATEKKDPWPRYHSMKQKIELLKKSKA